MKLVQSLQRFINDESGATAVEYGLMASLIAGVIILSVTGLGQKIDAVFAALTTKIPTP